MTGLAVGAVIGAGLAMAGLFLLARFTARH